MASSVYELINVLLENGEIGILSCDHCGSEFIELDRYNHGSDWKRIEQDFADNGCCLIEGLYSVPAFDLMDVPTQIGWDVLTSIYRIIYTSGYPDFGICSSKCQVKLIKEAIAKLDKVDFDKPSASKALGGLFSVIRIDDPDAYHALLECLTKSHRKDMKLLEKTLNRLYVKYVK